MIENKIRIQAVCMCFVMIFTLVFSGITAVAKDEAYKDTYFRYFASEESANNLASYAATGENGGWQTFTNQKAGDYFLVDILKIVKVGKIVLLSKEQCYPGEFKVYLSTQKKDLGEPVLTQKGNENGKTVINIPEPKDARFIKIELVDGTEVNENPFNVSDISIFKNNASSGLLEDSVVNYIDGIDNRDYSKMLEKLDIDMSVYDGTRGSFAKIALDFAKIDEVESSGAMNLIDVSESDEFYKAINVLAAMNIISTEGEFRPYDDITVSEAYKVILNIMGYGHVCTVEGGWPMGYMLYASRIGLSKGVGAANDILDGDSAARLIYNAMFAPLIVQMSYGSNMSFTSQEDETPAKRWYNISEAEGVLYSTDKSSVTGKPLSSKDYIMLDDETFYKINEDADYSSLLGLNVIVLYN